MRAVEQQNTLIAYYILRLWHPPTHTRTASGRRHSRLALRGRHPLCGTGVLSVTDTTSRPPIVRPLMADRRPGPRPLTTTRTNVSPFAVALAAADMPAVWAAIGVDFLMFLKPSHPQDVLTSDCPALSVSWMCVLLYVALMWAMGNSSNFFPAHLRGLSCPGSGGKLLKSLEGVAGSLEAGITWRLAALQQNVRCSPRLKELSFAFRVAADCRHTLLTELTNV